MSTADVPGLTSLVVVAADSGPLLSGCIESALAAGPDVELVLVDNASRDGEVDRAETAHAGDPRLRVLRNAVNAGFGPACNRGAALARGDLLVFVNPDCTLPPAFAAGLRRCLESAAGIGLLGVDVRGPDGSPARGNRRRDPTLRRALASLSGLARLEARWPALAGIEIPGSAGTTPAIETVEAVSGACMALPREVFARLGGFDESYFLHVEDLDLCRRVRDAGLRVAIAHEIRVVHAGGSSSRHRPLFVARHKHRGMWRYFDKFDPAARSGWLRALVWSGIWLHFVVVAPLQALRAAWRRGRSAGRGRFTHG